MPAIQILQSFLDDAGTATLAGDWDAFFAHVSLPFHLVTETASITVADEAGLRVGFDHFGDMLRVMRISDYVRLAESADEIGPDLISGHYVTHLMSGAHRMVPPFHSHVTLRREGGRWRAASIVNALSNARWPISVPIVAQTPSSAPSPTPSPERDLP